LAISKTLKNKAAGSWPVAPKASCCYSSSLLAGGFVKQLEEGFFGKKESRPEL